MAKRSVLAIGGNRFPFHRFEDRGSQLADALGDRIEVTLTTDKDDLVDLSEYDAVLDYLTDSSLTEAQRTSLLSFIEDGGGYIGIHCAADLTSTADPEGGIEGREEPFPELRNLIGGHFITHPEQAAFDVRVVDHYHPITAALDDIRVWDEPYLLEVDDDIRVLARMDHPEHADMPVAWTKEYGDGRMFYCSLGHGRPAVTNSGVQQLIRNGAHWTMDQ